MEIKLSDLWSLFKKCVILLLVVAIVCGAAMFVGTKLFVQEIYSSSITLMMVPLSGGSVDIEDTNSQLIVISRIMADIDLPLKSRTTMQGLKDYLTDRSKLEPDNEMLRLDYDYSAIDLQKMLIFTLPESADYKSTCRITVNAYSAHDAAVILSAFCDICNAHIPEHYAKVCKLIPLDEPLPGVKTAPNATRNAVVGALLGAVLTFVIAFMARLLNQRMYTEEDLSEAFSDIPVIGQIPVIKTRRGKEKTGETRKESTNA